MVSKQFCTAGRAVLTVSGPDVRYTFKIKFKKGTNGYKDAYFVSLLTGPDNTSDYTYLGMLDAENGIVRLIAVLLRQFAGQLVLSGTKANYPMGTIFATKAVVAFVAGP